MKVCFYFQVHQPMRLAPFSVFESGAAGGGDELFQRYFNHDLNRQIMAKVASKCYLPANRLLLELKRVTSPRCHRHVRYFFAMRRNHHCEVRASGPAMDKAQRNHDMSA